MTYTDGRDLCDCGNSVGCGLCQTCWACHDGQIHATLVVAEAIREQTAAIKAQTEAIAAQRHYESTI